MAVSKVSFSIDEGVLGEARHRAGPRQLSSYMTGALRRQLQSDRIGDLLADMDAESGPVPEETLEEARRLWAAPAPSKRSRDA